MANYKNLRFQFLLELLKNRGDSGASFADIKDYIERRFEDKDIPYNYKERTFERDKCDLLTERDIQLNYTRSRNIYTINWSELSEEQNFQIENDWLQEALRQNPYQKHFIHFEKRPTRGLNWLYGLIYAIDNHQLLQFTYHKFREDTYLSHTVQPYALKEFDYHWYLLACDTAPNNDSPSISVFALDRITDLDILKETFTPAPFNVEEHFRNAYGVIALPDPPEDIILRFDRHQGNYAKVRPLHPSQEILTDNAEELVIHLHLTPSYDFDQKLLSLGNRVQVIEPQWYREHIVMRLKQALDNYK